jgi:hypothetical protein
MAGRLIAVILEKADPPAPRAATASTRYWNARGAKRSKLGMLVPRKLRERHGKK